MNWYYLFISLEGRIARRHFWLGVGAILAFQLIIQVPVMSAAGIDPSRGPPPVWFRNLSLLLDIVCSWPLFAVVAKRGQDRNQAPHFAFWLVALLLLFSSLEALGLTQVGPDFTAVGYLVGLPLLLFTSVVIGDLGIRRGTDGPNLYGPDPTR